MLRPVLALLTVLLALTACPAAAEDGYRLWLRYDLVEPEARAAYRVHARAIVGGGTTPMLRAAEGELLGGLTGLLGSAPRSSPRSQGGAILLGTPRSSREIAALRLPLHQLGREGFTLRSIGRRKDRRLVIAANEDVGVLYGAFALLRRMQTRQSINGLNVVESPAKPVRMLNHWDNLDRTVERGYSGFSIWDWHKLPQWVDPRITDYARANASIGINATVLTNVNANAEVLTPAYLRKVAAIADVLRPWGLRVYLTARFSAPIELGGLPTADPLDQRVRAWWRAKSNEIYRAVPDFGGFLVKANSEGQPGPQDYGRDHAAGANLLADALAPHGGTVIWRAFVYTATPGTDRARQAYDEFKPLDGKFRPNVMLQVKNGPIDFQPREPFHPLFGQMPSTPLALEAQITKEYLGFATHLAYLGTMWEEVLDAQTGTATDTVAGAIHGMAGVANIGTDRNWSGSHFDQANWYAFGRLAWNPRLSARDIAREWTRMTWSNEPDVVDGITAMMMSSHQAVVDYMTPLGLHHLMATGHHYGPGPWVDDLEREDCNPICFHRADRKGIGFDRTASGSNAVGQYAPPVRWGFSDPQRTGEEYLLWFHRLPWEHRMSSGRSLWAELVGRYDRGIRKVEAMRSTWQRLQGHVDPERHAQVEAFLTIQAQEAKWWRDASLAYWMNVSGRLLPPGIAPPPHNLEHYKAIRFPHAPGQPR